MWIVTRFPMKEGLNAAIVIVDGATRAEALRNANPCFEEEGIRQKQDHEYMAARAERLLTGKVYWR